MALQRPIARALACQNCQRWVLRSFITGIGGQHATPFASHQSARPLSRTPKRFNEARERIQQVQKEEEHPLNDINDEVEYKTHPQPKPVAEEPPSNQPTQEHIPWYLLAQEPVFNQMTSPMSARQRMPDLPSHPPPLLKPLLEHVSVELGMDDLSILDLRSLDPPPALGANLLMLIGTARSERHLHVSADRLCRWLRTEYKMHPYADGLLGRNELKLKLRRKAKRSRLLSAVGAKSTADTELDEGIRTGWVCVNVGRVEGGELPKSEEESRRDEEMVGFGSLSGGSNIVVQMLTEEKRGEIGLEDLWAEQLERAEKRRAKVAEKTEDESAEDVGAAQKGSKAAYTAMHVSNQDAGQQLRAYHSSARTSR
ncbi:ATPase synthesis protein 25 mitochondrial [Vermiconidia calcicola]|uniref:ATPase synthesis protein 25 mitochondrial n=1 Tax=Vermiconidia calcicola TaxID=1690605 RepID=A0ACC3NQI6_9PEZI|nr:ATPase synthesis protein 25 mitochondrial [Vermiconidia calcicola]